MFAIRAAACVISSRAKERTRALAQPFIQYRPQLEDYWRAIILFGRNVASYKFALGNALLDLRPAAGQLVTLEELAVPFARHLCAHLKLADKQATFRSSRFLDACRKANAGKLTEQQLAEQTVKLGFANVIDAFHIVGPGEVQQRFFLDERKQNNGIRTTDAFSRLLEAQQLVNLPTETEARWRLVETAWELGVSRNILVVNHNAETERLFVIDAAKRRKPITGARTALSGYQKGHCFYCFDTFSVLGVTPPDVDHFFPHVLKAVGFGAPVDGVWNLVLACRRCNRGIDGKSARVPTLRLLERLHTRNEFLIGSHHPLRETLMAQTGATESPATVGIGSQRTTDGNAAGIEVNIRPLECEVFAGTESASDG